MSIDLLTSHPADVKAAAMLSRLHGYSATSTQANRTVGRCVYAIEKAVQEATKAVNAGATPAAIAAAEKIFAANKIAMKAIRDAVGPEGLAQLTRAGIVATLSGMKDDGEEE